MRNLAREAGAVVRYLVAKLVGDNEATDLETVSKISTVVDKSMLIEILGPTKFEEDPRSRLARIGVSTGLAYTGNGSGSVLYIECVQMEGKGKVQITGSVADVMQESVHTAISWIRSNIRQPSSAKALLDGQDLHVHFPAGATKKDGPSAGVAIVVALVSLVTHRRVNPECAMTGEVSLTGAVLPIGGLKEKSLAAARNGIKKVFIPARNVKDLYDVPESVKKVVEFIPVDSVEQVLEKVFLDDAPIQSKL